MRQKSNSTPVTSENLARDIRRATRKHHAAEEKIRIVLDGQYEDPVCIVAFNTAEGWSRDVTVDIADEVRRRFIEHEDAPASLLRFLEAVNRH